MKQIPLSQSRSGKYKSLNLFATIDDHHFNNVSQYKWQARKRDFLWYAYANIDGEFVSLHRIIMGCKKGDGKVVDHKDRNGLNCTDDNLRFSTISQNMRNRKSAKNSSSKYLGVSVIKPTMYKVKSGEVRIAKRSRPYMADIESDGIKMKLGYFEKEIDAAIAYNKAAKLFHGEFANLNLV